MASCDPSDDLHEAAGPGADDLHEDLKEMEFLLNWYFKHCQTFPAGDDPATGR